MAVLEGLESELEASLENLKINEINASWELAGWVSLSEAEIASLEVEYDRKQVFADRTATVLFYSNLVNLSCPSLISQVKDHLVRISRCPRLSSS